MHQLSLELFRLDNSDLAMMPFADGEVISGTLANWTYKE
jgi:hypothetical protein